MRPKGRGFKPTLTRVKAVLTTEAFLKQVQTELVDIPETLISYAGDQVGEIWVSGSGIGKGYWNQPQATQETFTAYLADTNEGPFLRTGDLGFIADGELYITGRLKDIMIFWGVYQYPH